MKTKTTILNSFFFISLILEILIKTNHIKLTLISANYLYSFFVTIPLFVLQFVSLANFSRRIKKEKPSLFKKACSRSNGTQGNSINVASLFDESLPFSEMKEEYLIQKLRFTKRVVIYSMLSFVVLIILFLI